MVIRIKSNLKVELHLIKLVLCRTRPRRALDKKVLCVMMLVFMHLVIKKNKELLSFRPLFHHKTRRKIKMIAMMMSGVTLHLSQKMCCLWFELSIQNFSKRFSSFSVNSKNARGKIKNARRKRRRKRQKHHFFAFSSNIRLNFF